MTKVCDVNKNEELDMDTDSLYLALAEKELADFLRPEMKAEWEQPRSNGCTKSVTADAVGSFSLESVVTSTKETWQARAWFFQRGVQVFENAVFVVELVAATTKSLTSSNSAAKASTGGY